MQPQTNGLTLENPTNEEAYTKIKSGISRHKTVIVAGKCTVDYDGRAASRLESGERLVIFKSDGSALIHRPRDYSPVNWQPSGSLFNTKMVKGKLVIRVYRPKEKETLEFLKQWLPERTSPMCGNSICQDRRFLARCMPELEAFFHYRNLDVSTLKELVVRWAPDLMPGFKKNGSHLALDDVKESIAELAYYRQHFIQD